MLKKPFTAIELDNLYKEALKGDDAQSIQRNLVAEFIAFIEKRLEEGESKLRLQYDEDIKNIPNEKKIRKLEQGTPEWSSAITEREQELQKAKEDSIKQLRAKSENRRYFMEKAMNFFYIGRQVYYPAQSFGTDKELVLSVCLGFVVDYKKKNPFAASVVKLRFALANSNKYLVMPLSYFEDISAIMGVSSDVGQKEWQDYLIRWEHHIQENNTDRKIRHIVTGNLLQAFADYKGKLVSYTTIDGKIEKGILMPEHWETEKQGLESSVAVPIIKALPFIRSLVKGQNIQTSTGIAFIRSEQERFKVIVEGSRAKGGEVYLDAELLALVEQNNFNKLSNKMVAYLGIAQLPDFIEVLQRKHACSVSLPYHQFKTVQQREKTFSNRKTIRLPEAEKESSSEDLRLFELEAEAILIKLRLMAA